MLVLLIPAPSEEPTLGPEAAGRLADLGVAHVAVAMDGEGVVLVLSGWSFDPDRSREAAMEVLCAGAPCRALAPVAQMSLNGSPKDR